MALSMANWVNWMGVVVVPKAWDTNGSKADEVEIADHGLQTGKVCLGGEKA